MPFLVDRTPASVVIAGAGGFALELYDYLLHEQALGGPEVAGFLDDTPGGRVPEGVGLPWLGTIDGYVAHSEQVVVVAIASIPGREAVHGRLWQRGASTPAFVDGRAIVSASARLGQAVIVCPLAVVNRNACMDDGAVANVHCSVGHGASVGAFSILSPYAALNGDASIGRACFLGTRATIYPRIAIGNGCVVDSHTGVRSPVPERHLVSMRGEYHVVRLRT